MTRADVAKKQYSGVVDCVGRLYQEGGPLRFYRGMPIRACRIALQMAIQFAMFESLKEIAV